MPRRKTTQRVKTANGAGSVTYNKVTKRYMARYTLRDPETAESIRKTLYGATEQEARAKLIDALKAKQDGTVTVTKGRSHTVESYAAKWLLAKESRIRVRSLHRYREVLDIWIIPTIGKTQLTALQPSQVERLMNEAIKKGRSARTANYIRQTLRALLNAALKDGLVGRNVAQMADSMEQRDQHMKVLTPEQAKILMSTAELDTDGPLWITALTTGARQGELLGLTWDVVDLDARTMVISRSIQFQDGTGFLVEKTKTERSTRMIVLPELAVQALRVQRQRQVSARLKTGSKWVTTYGDLVFSDLDGGPLKATTITKRLQRRLTDLGLPAIPFHSLRHSAASLLAAAGVKMFDVSRTLGHSNIATTSDIYSEMFDEQRQGVADAMDRVLTDRR